MYQDEKLVCEDCGAEFVFTAGEQEFYAEKDVRNAEKLAETTTEEKEKCMMLFALNAVLKLKFRSNLFRVKKYTAENALQKNTKKIKYNFSNNKKTDRNLFKLVPVVFYTLIQLLRYSIVLIFSSYRYLIKFRYATL